jgi:hypothetical protein
MPWSMGNNLLLSWVYNCLGSEQLGPSKELLVQFPLSSDDVELSPLRKNNHTTIVEAGVARIQHSKWQAMYFANS